MYIGLQMYSSNRSQQQGKGNEEIMRQRAREREAQMYVLHRFWRGTRRREAPRSFGVGTLDRLRTKEFTHKSAREPETPKIYNCCRFKKHGQENRRRHTDRQTKRERERERDSYLMSQSAHRSVYTHDRIPTTTPWISACLVRILSSHLHTHPP